MEKEIDNRTVNDAVFQGFSKEGISKNADEPIPEMPIVRKEEELKKQKKCNYLLIITLLLSVIAVLGVATLFCLHFCGGKSKNIETFTPVALDEPGSGEVVYFNMDTINKYYKLVNILSKDLDNESSKHQASITAKRDELQKRAAQFQKNYEAGVLTQSQMQNGYDDLTVRQQNLESEYQMIMNNLQAKELEHLKTIHDSIVSAIKYINTSRKASFVFSYQFGGQLVEANNHHDITKEVLDYLNRHYPEE
jgi:Skp family chaperone for outer membrane proteins